MKSPEKQREGPDVQQKITDKGRQVPERLEDESGVQSHHVACTWKACAERVHVHIKNLVERAAAPAEIAEETVEDALA